MPTCSLLVGDYKSQCGGSAKKKKNGSTIRFSYNILGYISYTYSKDTRSSVFMAALTNPRKRNILDVY